MSLRAVLGRAARTFGARPAIVAVDRYAMMYADLDRLSDAVAGGLQRRGIGVGDVVALVLPSSPEYLVAYLAAAKLGAVTAGVNPRLSAPQRAALLDAADPALVVGTPALLEGTAEHDKAIAVPLADRADECLRLLHADGASLPPDDPDRTVAIVFTSGTSGPPRGAVFTAGHLEAIDDLDTSGAPDGSGGPMLMSTELVHVGAMTKLLWYLRLGMTIHVLARWRAGDALRVVSSERMTSIGGIAPQIALLLRQPDFDNFDVTAVETIVAGGAPSSPALVAEARTRFDAAYSIRYSSTESGGVGTGTAFDAPDEEALHTVGRPRPGVQLDLRDEDGRTVDSGEIGTVWLRSSAVMAGYWRDTQATAHTLVDGWLRTGDLGLIDDAGCLRLAGRANDMFIRGGYNVHPETVEAVLSRHPAISDVAIVPRTNDVLGEIGVATIVPADPETPPSLEDLRDYAQGFLAHHELPEALRIVDRLPYTALHKLDRRRLRAQDAPPPPET